MSELLDNIRSLRFLNWGTKKTEEKREAVKKTKRRYKRHNAVSEKQIVKAIKAHKHRVGISQICKDLGLPPQGTYWMKVKRVVQKKKLGRSIQRWKI